MLVYGDLLNVALPLNILYRLMVDQFSCFVFAITYGECVLFSLSLVMSNFLPILS